MANVKNPKLFTSDLSNYAEIRRGLSPAMRKLTVSKTDLKKLTPDVQQAYIRQLNEWRMQGQAAKQASAHTQEGVSSALLQAGRSNYYGGRDKVKEKVVFATAGLKLKTMSPKVADWEVREALSVVDRLHDQAFYKAQYFLDAGTWDATKATNNMLISIIRGGTLQNYGEDIFDATVREFVRRTHGLSEEEMQDGFSEMLVTREAANLEASYYSDLYDIARVIAGIA